MFHIPYNSHIHFLVGAVFHYLLVNFILWWFFHLCIFFYKVVCPFHANRMEKMGQHKYIFTTFVFLGMYTHYQVCHYYHTIALFVPLPAVIVSLSVEEHHYRLYCFPPTICISSGAMCFYSTNVIIDVLVGIGVYLLIIVFWIIKRVIYIYIYIHKHDIYFNLFRILCFHQTRRGN